MATDILMPNLGFDTQEARILEWHKQPGDTVRRGEILAIIESDKANVELESVADGVVLEHLFPADTMVAVGQTIARVGSKNEQPVSQPAAAVQSSPDVSDNLNVSPIARRIADDNQIDLSKVAGTGAGGRIMRQDVESLLKPNASAAKSDILALPKVRKLAREAGIDLKLVSATGASGQVTLSDLQLYQQTTFTPPAARVQEAATVSTNGTPQPPREIEGAQEVVLSRMRQTIGQRLSKSMQDAPHFYVTGEFDVESAIGRLGRLAEPRPRINDLIQYLTVQTLLRVPELNATFENGRLYRHQSVHLAIAVGLEDGLITPVISNAQRYSLQGMVEEGRALIERARNKRLRLDDLREGTFTISNLGVIKQVDQFTAVINPPQVAILAVGTVKQRPVVIDGGLHIRHTVKLTLSGDHRVVDGMTLGQFMAAFQAELDVFSGKG
jgi:pyruvate dehydrogenase E2 component (dihydrolipoamide acetyltransferase)